MSFQDFLTPDEAADLIGCSGSRVRQMLRDGILAGKKVGERMWLVSEQEAKKAKENPASTGRPRKIKKHD